MAANDEPTARGPRGGKKHQPGKGHDRKSQPSKKGKFRRKAQRHREARASDLERQWAEWVLLTDFEKRLRPELRPKGRRPSG